jgi:tetratricopeptide (TPR) repeat protein
MLCDAGLNMGDDLIEARIDNPNGFYEDLSAVKLHEKLLEESGSSLMFYDEVKLPTMDKTVSRLTPYVEKRYKQTMVWGMKDPRACLFLDAWNKALGSDGYYVLIYRHWALCIQSLVNRHSKWLLVNFPKKRELIKNMLALWSHPERAALMWISYNRRMLTFVKKHRKKVVLINHSSLLEGFPIARVLNEKADVSLKEKSSKIFNPSLLNDEVDASIVEPFSKALISKLNALWDELNEMADVAAKENPSITPSKKYDIVEFNIDVEPACKVDCNFKNSDDIEQLIVLAKKSITGNSIEVAEEILTKLIKKNPDDFESLLCQGQLHRLLKNFDQSELCLMKACNIKTSPQLLFEIGQTYEHRKNFKKAGYYYLKAIQANPNISPFPHWLRLGYVLYQSQDYDGAQHSIINGLKLASQNESLRVIYSRILTKKGKHRAALQVLCEQEKPSWFIRFRKAEVMMSIDVKQGLKEFENTLREKLQQEGLATILSKVLQHIDNSHGFNQLYYWILKHFYSLVSCDDR